MKRIVVALLLLAPAAYGQQIEVPTLVMENPETEAGPVDTDLFHAGKTDEAKARMASLSPFNRIGQPGEVAEVVAFLASARASWVQGQVIQPNGGMV